MDRAFSRLSPLRGTPMRLVWAGAAVLTLAACDSYTEVIAPPAAASSRRSRSTIRWSPSGPARRPRGCCCPGPTTAIPNLAVWHVYSRGSTTEAFGLRGSTTSNTFHDNGVPDLQYYVTAEDLNGFESVPSPTDHHRRAPGACRRRPRCSASASTARSRSPGRDNAARRLAGPVRGLPGLQRGVRPRQPTSATWTGSSRAPRWRRSSSPARSPNGAAALLRGDRR